MNRPAMEGLRLNTPASVRHARLINWVAEMAALTEARHQAFLQAARFFTLCG